MANSEIFTIRMTPNRTAQLSAVEQRTGLQGLAAVIDFALATTLAHYEQEVVAMDTIDSILVQSMPDDAGQFGADADLSDIDVAASYAAYDAAIFDALTTEYPGAEVVVRDGADCIEVNSRRDHAEIPWIEKLIHEAWSAWEWVVTD